jgi:DNA-binding transcriptional LysR family regulator
VEPSPKIADLWSSLPVFQIVAETEHLPSAARALSLSKSAISRIIKRLEHRLGYALFDRPYGRLKLNAAGVQLLAAVRDATSRVAQGVGRGRANAPSRETLDEERMRRALAWQP